MSPIPLTLNSFMNNPFHGWNLLWWHKDRHTSIEWYGLEWEVDTRQWVGGYFWRLLGQCMKRLFWLSMHFSVHALTSKLQEFWGNHRARTTLDIKKCVCSKIRSSLCMKDNSLLAWMILSSLTMRLGTSIVTHWWRDNAATFVMQADEFHHPSSCHSENTQRV